MEATGRRATLVAALALAVATLASSAFVAAQDSGGGDVKMTVGEEVSVLASAQEAQVRHEVEDRAWEQQTETGEAGVQDRVEELRQRLDRVEERKAEIDRRVEAGEISERRAAALKANVETQAEATNRSVDRMMEHAEARGANTTALEQLKQRASEMTGQEVRKVARNVGAGPRDVGRPDDARLPGANESRPDGRPDDVGGAEDPSQSQDGAGDAGGSGGSDGGPPSGAGPAS